MTKFPITILVISVLQDMVLIMACVSYCLLIVIKISIFLKRFFGKIVKFTAKVLLNATTALVLLTDRMMFSFVYQLESTLKTVKSKIFLKQEISNIVLK